MSLRPIDIAAALGITTILLTGPIPARAQTAPDDISISPSTGPIGTVVTVDAGPTCHLTLDEDAWSVLFVKGVATEGQPGTVGEVEVHGEAADPDAALHASFRVPASLLPREGEGGGAVSPGTYEVVVNLTCSASFTVSASSVARTGGLDVASWTTIAVLLVVAGAAALAFARKRLA